MLAFVVTVPVDEAELAADVLWQLGVSAVEERPTGDDGRMVELWTSLGDDAATVQRAAEAFPARWRWHTVDVDDTVVDAWRRHAGPMWIRRDVVVVPSWIDHDVPDDVTAVSIDPGSSFGLGDHPTTRVSAQLLWEHWWSGATVADIGCGSGVLAVLAARRGAPFVEAIDVASAAIEATRANADRNEVASVINASARPAADLDGPYDIVVANILAPVLVVLAPELRRLSSPSGLVIVSGVLDGRYDHVVEALAPMHVIETRVLDGWAGLVLRH